MAGVAGNRDMQADQGKVVRSWSKLISCRQPSTPWQRAQSVPSLPPCASFVWWQALQSVPSFCSAITAVWHAPQASFAWLPLSSKRPSRAWSKLAGFQADVP